MELTIKERNVGASLKKLHADPKRRAFIAYRVSIWMMDNAHRKALAQRVKDITHYDYDVQPYTLEDLAADFREVPESDLREALIACGYMDSEARERCRNPHSNYTKNNGHLGAWRGAIRNRPLAKYLEWAMNGTKYHSPGKDASDE